MNSLDSWTWVARAVILSVARKPSLSEIAHMSWAAISMTVLACASFLYPPERSCDGDEHLLIFRHSFLLVSTPQILPVYHKRNNNTPTPNPPSSNQLHWLEGDVFSDKHCLMRHEAAVTVDNSDCYLHFFVLLLVKVWLFFDSVTQYLKQSRHITLSRLLRLQSL